MNKKNLLTATALALASMTGISATQPPQQTNGQPTFYSLSSKWPFNGKNRAQRQRLNSGFMAMA